MILGVDLQESAEAVRGFQKEFGISFPLLLDRAGRVAQMYGIRGHPTTFLIDRQGRLVGVVPGERDWMGEPARRVVEQLLSEGVPVK